MDKFIRILSDWNIDITDLQLELFERYLKMLISWNRKINLTTITDREEIYIKHFADSIAILNYADISGKSILDVGTGAGFPGIPISIMCPSCRMVLLDSLNKRIAFLNEVINSLGLKDVCAVHGRAEDLAHDEKFRGRFDVVTSRAVSNLSVLSEYCLPFVDMNGYFVSYKSGNIDEELESAGNAVSTLGGLTERVERFVIPETGYERSLICIKKICSTDNKYPRKAGVPSRKPL